MKNIFVVLQHRLLAMIRKICGSPMDYIDIMSTFLVQKEKLNNRQKKRSTMVLMSMRNINRTLTEILVYQRAVSIRFMFFSS